MGRKIAWVMKGLLVAYAITGLLLLGLAFLVYRFQIGESITNISIVAIYVLVTFAGGFVTGKKVKEHKYIWGFLLGTSYILIISILAVALGYTFHVASTANFTTIALCIGGGMIGGMLS